MKTKRVKKSNPVQVLIPYFCYHCATGSEELSDYAFEQFNAIKAKKYLSSYVIKYEFKDIQERIQNPKEFWPSIMSILQNIENELCKELSYMLTNSIKRLISITANELNLEQRTCAITTNCIISDLETYQLFIQELYKKINSLEQIIFVYYDENYIAFLPYTLENNSVVPLTEVMMSNVKDYWNTTSFQNQ